MRVDSSTFQICKIFIIERDTEMIGTIIALFAMTEFAVFGLALIEQLKELTKVIKDGTKD